MTRKRILTSAVCVLVLAAVGGAVYSHLRAKASERVKAEMLRVAADLTLSPDERASVRRLIESAHDEAFNNALNLTRRHGRKFDEQSYFNDVFDRVITDARAEGLTELADRLERARPHFSFTVTEQ